MLRRRFCLFLFLLLALASLPAWAEDAAQRYDFNGDGEADEGDAPRTGVRKQLRGQGSTGLEGGAGAEDEGDGGQRCAGGGGGGHGCDCAWPK